MIYVTHDQVEAMTLADRIVVLANKGIAQVGSPLELYERPENEFVAQFIGSPAMNLITATVSGSAERPIVEFAGHTLAIDERAVARYPQLPGYIGREVIIGIRPEHFAMDEDVVLPDDQHVSFHVDLAEAMGAEVHIHATIDIAPVSIEGAPVVAEDGDEVDTTATHVIARVEGIHVVETDSQVRLGVKTHLVHFFDPETGEPLR